MFSLKLIKFCIGLTIALLLSGCVKHYQLAQTETPQGTLQPRYDAVTNRNLRSVQIYNEYTTEAIFDALWLSDEVRATYVKIKADKRGLDLQEQKALLRRQLEENKHWLTFQVLAQIPDKVHDSLSEEHPRWNCYIVTKKGEKISPLSIKEIELTPEIKYIFGYRADNFKVPYLVKFPAHDMAGNYYADKTGNFSMVFASAEISGTVNWGGPKPPEKKKDRTANYMRVPEQEQPKNKDEVLKNEDFYWF